MNVLFLCTGNSARSILAESILNGLGEGRFTAYSAGSHPAGRVNPHALSLLRRLGYPTDGLRSKSWDEFSALEAPQMDLVITVCDSAANEPCPIWPGHPTAAHWGIPDPAAVEGAETEKQHAFADAYHRLSKRIELFLKLPLASLEKSALRQRLAEIGGATPEDT